MTDGFPLLEQMRADLRRQEAEVSAPYRAQIDGLSRLNDDLRATIRGTERALGSKIAGYMIEQVAREVSGAVMRAISEAVAKAGAAREPMTITLSSDALRFGNPRSLESEILRRYASETVPALKLGVGPMPNEFADVVDIRIPPLGHRFVSQRR